MPTIGKQIQKRRKELGWTQEDLATKMGYKSKSSINKIEMGINDIPQSKIVKFAQILNTTPACLMGWDEDAALAELPTSNNFSETDPLWAKITKLDDADRSKVDAYTDGLLAADKYQEHTQQLKIAARGGGIKEITITDSQLQEIMNLPKVADLDDNS